MDKIKIKMHIGNKHFVWGLSFLVFSLVASIVWGLTYAEDTTSISTTIIPTTDTTTQDISTTTSTTNTQLPITTTTSTTTPTINTTTTQLQTTTSGGGGGSYNTTTITAPAAPSGFEPYTTLTSSMTVIPLRWTDNSNNETSFVIEKKLNTVGTYAPLYTTGTNAIYYTDSYSIVKDVLYDYRIKACSSTSSCSDYVYLLGIKIPPTTNVVTNPGGGSSTCTGLNLDLNDGKTTYTVGQYVNYTWTCNPTGSTGTVSIWLNKPDGSMSNFNTTSNSNTQSMGFNTSNLAPGQYALKACLGTSCSTYGGTITAQVFNVVSTLTTPTKQIEPVVPTTIVNPSTTTTTTNTPPVSPTPPTTITTTPTKPVEPVITKIPTTTTMDTTKALFPTKSLTEVMPTNPNIEVASSSAEIKVPTPLEIPKDIIESVTAALNIIPQNVPLVKTDINQTEQEKIEVAKEETAKQEVIKQEITKLVYQDTNKDGISDYDSKYVYNMDPVKPSLTSTYEGKKITAGEKILLGFDPGKKELEKVVVEEPTTELKPEIVVASYRVNEVSFVDTAPVKETTPTKEIKPTKAIKLKGQALPNSFITIYIYSTPIMVTVKTDSNGEWQYTMDKELENGNHTVYTATVNNTGNIVAKSTPFTFVKTAEAVSLQDIAPIKSINVPTTVVERPGFLQTKNVLIIGISFLMILGITLILIGLLSKKKSEEGAQ